MNKKHIIHALSAVAFAVAIGMTATACSDDDKTVTVPENWVNVSGDVINVDYHGTGDTPIEVAYTLASGLDGSVPYVVNNDSWCHGYIDGGKLYVKVDESENIRGRQTTMDLMYDQDHKVTLNVVQGKSPVISVTGFDVSDIPSTINMGEALDLDEVIAVLPANASFKTLTYELVSGSEVVSLSGSTVIGKNPGEAVIKVMAMSDDEVAGAGVSTEVKVKVKGDLRIDRSDWTLTSPVDYVYIPDGSTGKLTDLIDGKTNTFFSICKPGKTYNGLTTPASTKIGFTIDMKKEQTFNYFFWQHRDTSRSQLQVWGITMYGSNDGSSWTKIKDVDITQNVHQSYSLGADYTYRYIKVEYTKFNTSSGSSCQVAEFYLGRLME